MNEPNTPPALIVEIKIGNEQPVKMRFTGSFVIGRQATCDLQIKNDLVSRNHVEISCDDKGWRAKDLGSLNGTLQNGKPIKEIQVPDEAELELGKGGPLISLLVEREEQPEMHTASGSTRQFGSETQILQHVFDDTQKGKEGEQTMMFKRAFERHHKKRSKKYRYVIVIALVLLLTAGGVIVYQKQKFDKLKNAAQDIFYTMKTIELQISQMESIVLAQADPDQKADLLAKRSQLKELARQYDNFVSELGLYDKMSIEEQAIFRIARLFGECDVNVPEGFKDEVLKYIARWKSTSRLKNALDRAKSKEYIPHVVKSMDKNNLPIQFFFLALQESSFNDKAVGPKTRYGYAKGIWQFIPQTATEYGLKVGPLYKKKVYDKQDERFDFAKATAAAARYLRHINNTEAQASGLLVMASYNWGQTRVRKIIKQMPENPRERNFWKLLSMKDIPQETYDYVFYIFSAVVICENPGLFGFDFECPKMG